MKKIKHNDIVVREYPSGRTAIGIYKVRTSENMTDRFLYLDKTFVDDGGLTQFGLYGVGSEPLYYRYVTSEEYHYIIKELKTHQMNKYLKIVNNFSSKMRKEKLIRLNEIQNEN